MAKHNDLLEPSVSFTPDLRWTVFRSTMHGAVPTSAVEIAKSK
jgi:oligogalacturonide lyase